MRKIQLNLFEIGYLLIVISEIISLTVINKRIIIFSLYFMGCVFILYNIINMKYSIKKLILFVIIGSFCLASYFRSTENIMLTIFLMIISTKKIDLQKLIKYDLILRSLLIILIMISASLGIIYNIVYDDINGCKESLGFSHPNHLGLMVFIIVLYYVYIKHKRLKLYDVLFLLCCFFISFFVSGSRTSSFLIILLLVFEIFNTILFNHYKYNHLKNKLVILIRYFVFFIPIVSIILAYYYDDNNSILRKLNSLLTGRLYLAYHSALNNKLTLFGSFIEYKGGRFSDIEIEFSNAIDNSYVYVLLHLGIIVFLLFLLLLWFTLSYFLKTNNRVAIICLAFLMTAGFVESKVFQISHNIFLLCIIPAIYNINNKKCKLKYKI